MITGDERVNKIIKNFETALGRCADDSNPRQKVISEQRNGHAYVTVISTFKFGIPDQQKEKINANGK